MKRVSLLLPTSSLNFSLASSAGSTRRSAIFAIASVVFLPSSDDFATAARVRVVPCPTSPMGDMSTGRLSTLANTREACKPASRHLFAQVLPCIVRWVYSTLRHVCYRFRRFPPLFRRLATAARVRVVPYPTSPMEICRRVVYQP